MEIGWPWRGTPVNANTPLVPSTFSTSKATCEAPVASYTRSMLPTSAANWPTDRSWDETYGAQNHRAVPEIRRLAGAAGHAPGQALLDGGNLNQRFFGDGQRLHQHCDFP